MFNRSNGTGVLKLEAMERALLVDLLEQVVSLLDVEHPHHSDDPLVALLGPEGPTEISDDPALARLFPQAYTDDDEASSEFRRFTEPTMRSLKVEHALMAADSIRDDSQTKFPLTQEQVLAWLAALNDLRLILGTRLEITDEGPDYEDDNPSMMLYSWLTSLQSRVISFVE